MSTRRATQVSRLLASAPTINQFHKSSKSIVPKNWPSNVQFIQQMKPLLQEIFSTEIVPSNSKVAITKILDPNHPVRGHFGLHAAVDIPANTTIGFYMGEIITHNPKDPAYLYYIGTINNVTYYIDAKEYGNEMRFVNDYRKIAPSPNVKFTKLMSPNTPFNIKVQLSSLRDISQGEELLVDYGSCYWTD
jgi:hypothetical protein